MLDLRTQSLMRIKSMVLISLDTPLIPFILSTLFTSNLFQIQNTWRFVQWSVTLEYQLKILLYFRTDRFLFVELVDEKQHLSETLPDSVGVKFDCLIPGKLVAFVGFL